MTRPSTIASSKPSSSLSSDMIIDTAYSTPSNACILSPSKRPRVDSFYSIAATNNLKSLEPVKYCSGLEFESAFRLFPFYIIPDKTRIWRLDVENSKLHNVKCFDNHLKLK